MRSTDNFVWGVASSAFQTEGAFNADGKFDSIWDTFTKRKNKIAAGHHAEDASDFYNRYADDLQLMHSMSIRNFRFSLSWSRILPMGSNIINHKGIDFYKRVIDCCYENEIEPWLTLYHWDLPQILELKGGWSNRDIIYWFDEYVNIVIDHFGDRIKNWMVLNEPGVFTGAGYFLGIHAPGKKGFSNYLPALHHSALCQASGIRTIKNRLPDSNVGTTFSCSYLTPFRDLAKDQRAVDRVDALLNRLFIEPLLGYGYPTAHLPVLNRIEKYMKADDAQALVAIPDFAGIQNYTREVIKSSVFTPYLKAKIIAASKRAVKHTVMNWEVFPSSLYHMLMQFSTYPALKKIYVTENGAAFHDQLNDGEIYDPERTAYLQSCIAEMMRAKNDGAKVAGYFVWSFTDNFEWAEGYFPRFGLVHIDYQSQKRTIKSSGKWYSSFLESAQQVPHNRKEVFSL